LNKGAYKIAKDEVVVDETAEKQFEIGDMETQE